MINLFLNNIKLRKYVSMSRDFSFRVISQNFSYPQIFNKKYKNILILAPHPDDEIIGLGGFILQNKTKVKKVIVFTNSENQIRKNESLKVSKKLGIKYDFPFPGFRLNKRKSSKYILDQIKILKPDLILVSSFYETHPDHLNLFYALMDSLNTLNEEIDIGLYEVWNTLNPNYIVDISKQILEKKKLIKLYKSQIMDFDYIKFSDSLNKYRGMQIKKNYGEGIILLTSSEIKSILS